jgi:hypothetical protein
LPKRTKVTVSIALRSAARARPPAEGPRFGPYSVLEEEQPLKHKRGQARFTFNDMGVSLVIQTQLNLSTGLIQHRELFYSQYFAAGLVQSPQLGTVGSCACSRAELESGTHNALGYGTAFSAANLDPLNSSIFEGAASSPYRATFNRWALPIGSPLLANHLTLTFAGAPYVLGLAGSGWAVVPPGASAEEGRERAAPWSHFTTPADTSNYDNVWQQQTPDWKSTWWMDHGAVTERKFSRSSKWAIGTDNLIYEPFDPWDLTNFKVTSGSTYASPEIPLPPIAANVAGIQDVQVGLVGRFWDVSLTFKEWGAYSDFGNPPPAAQYLYQRGGSGSFQMLGMTCPYASILFAHDATTPAIRKDTTISWSWDGSHYCTNAAVNGFAELDGLPPQGAAFSAASGVGNPHSNFLMRVVRDRWIRRGQADPGGVSVSYSGPRPYEGSSTVFPRFATSTQPPTIANSDTSMTMTIAATPIGALVGKVRYAGLLYNIWRKTVNPGGAPVYSGAYEELDSFGTLAPMTVRPFYGESNSFGTFDPLNIAAHITV